MAAHGESRHIGDQLGKLGQASHSDIVMPISGAPQNLKPGFCQVTAVQPIVNLAYGSQIAD